MGAGWVSVEAFNELKRKIESIQIEGGEVLQDENALRISIDESEGGAPSNVYPAIVKSGGNGIYVVDILNAAGEVVETNVPAIPTRATGYNLAAGDYIVCYKVTIETLGSN